MPAGGDGPGGGIPPTLISIEDEGVPWAFVSPLGYGDDPGWGYSVKRGSHDRWRKIGRSSRDADLAGSRYGGSVRIRRI